MFHRILIKSKLATLLMNTALAVLLLFNVEAVVGKELPAACTTDCVTTYNQVLGVAAGGVTAYSNCKSHCVVPEPNKVNGTYTGIKWQCVEFARRWLLTNKGVVYGDVDYAIDIWDKIDHYQRVSDGKKIPVKSYPNGSARPPQVGDLLIYAKVMLGTGHVAVITDINEKTGTVKVAEQNYLNKKWPGNYSRQIKLLKDNNRYWLLDAYLIGWKRMDSSVFN